VLDDAAAAGARVDSPLAAVLATVSRLESTLRFDAGVGGAVQSDGAVRTDAGLTTGDRRVGAVRSMPGVERASEVARVVLEETPHVLVAGERAVALAEAFDAGSPGTELLTDRTRRRWTDGDPPASDDPREHLTWLGERYGGGDGAARESLAGGRDHDTVGAVAVDGDGDRTGTGTATGSRPVRRRRAAGRRSPAGSATSPESDRVFHAGAAAGVSATGAGEDIVRVTLAREAYDALANGADAATAADRALAEFESVTGSTVGLVVLGRDGSAGAAFDSAAMQTARARR